MISIISGVLITASFLAGLFFLKFWRRSRDRFFGLFAAAFWVLTLNWIGLTLTDPANEARTYFYLLRLGAFLLIILAIWDQNRPRRAKRANSAKST